MDRADEAVGLFRDGYCCSQAVLVAHASDYGLAADQAARLSAGFGGGMRLGGVCGAATGAIMVLGLHLCDGECVAGEGRDAVNTAVREFGSRFIEQVGSLDCPDILGCDLRTPEGMAKAKEQGLFETVCPEAVREAVRILADMLMSS